MYLRNPLSQHSVAPRLAADHLSWKSMCPDSCYQCIPLQQLSDESAVEILDFLQIFISNFESRYGDQIRRYYDQHSRHNIVQVTPVITDDPPF